MPSDSDYSSSDDDDDDAVPSQERVYSTQREAEFAARRAEINSKIFSDGSGDDEDEHQFLYKKKKKKTATKRSKKRVGSSHGRKLPPKKRHIVTTDKGKKSKRHASQAKSNMRNTNDGDMSDESGELMLSINPFKKRETSKAVAIL